VIVRGNTGHPGTIIVTAQAEGLKIGTVAIDATASGH
jgi:hypothetical protein